MGQVQSHGYSCEGAIIEDASNSGNLSKDAQAGKIASHKSKGSSYSSIISRDQHVRKLSDVSNRNIQLLSMKSRGEKEAYADSLRSRRRSSLINLILGAPSSGPRFSDDLCSLSSHISECTFGIEFFSELHNPSNIRGIGSTEDFERGDKRAVNPLAKSKRRRSSLGSIVSKDGEIDLETTAPSTDPSSEETQQPSTYGNQARRFFQSKSANIASTLASIDLTSSFEQHDKSSQNVSSYVVRHPLANIKHTTVDSIAQDANRDFKTRASKGRVNQLGRILRRSGSELSLYSATSASSVGSRRNGETVNGVKRTSSPMNETKLIIMLQVCLPFILAGFGNMAAGLVLNSVSQWRAFRSIPAFFVLLPPFVGLKGNIEMTLASRLSTLSNLNLLSTGYQQRRAFVTNLILITSQAISLSLFAAVVSILCEVLIGTHMESSYQTLFETAIFVVLASALVTSIILVVVSSIIMSLAVSLANYIQVNPDNLSTLIAALYGDVSCVLTYGLVADWMYTLNEQSSIALPVSIIVSTILAWPFLLYLAYNFEETRSIALPSMPPMLTAILVSMGSGAVLSLAVNRFRLISLYQPVVNGFGANLIAVQASRVSTWLWCAALRKISADDEDIKKSQKILGSLVSFKEPVMPLSDKKIVEIRPFKMLARLIRTILWSFFNSSPNAIAARLLLVMLIPAHTIYFFIIWLLSPANHVVITWQFYSIYIGLCLVQVFILLTICEPLMTLFMKNHLDPDIYGISLLMALADLTGTLCLAGAFAVLAGLGDPNALNGTHV